MAFVTRGRVVDEAPVYQDAETKVIDLSPVVVKPCPFCGEQPGGPYPQQIGDSNKLWYSVWCDNEECLPDEGDSPELAIEAWNTRV